MFTLTNYNIRRRYLEEKARAKARNEEPYTYAKMAAQFDSDDRTVYTWITRVRRCNTSRPTRPSRPSCRPGSMTEP